MTEKCNFELMKISGFTFLRNTSKLYYPVVESILSALPIVEEFVIALGEGDKDDNTEETVSYTHLTLPTNC